MLRDVHAVTMLPGVCATDPDVSFFAISTRIEPVGPLPTLDARVPTVTYGQVLLPSHEAILAAGTAVESLFIGRIRRHPSKLAASLLTGAERSRLPDHASLAYPVLRSFEAITLAERRAA